jgi:putative spermidine/putrescine transport system ATP-binding protein
MLETFGLAGLGSAAATELSGGQMQRVALARALVFQPRMLLLDEPLGALERPLRERLQRELKEMQRRTGALFLMVTHDREEAMAVSDLMLIMDQGRVQQSGTPLEVWNRPANAFVARFLLYGAVLRGKVEPDGGGWCVRTPDGLLLHRGSGPPLEARELEVAIRADHVRLCRGNDVGEGEVPCVGKVTDIRFAGPTALVTVAVGGSEIKASIASDDVPLLGAEGDTRFAFDCSRTLVFEVERR